MTFLKSIADVMETYIDGNHILHLMPEDDEDYVPTMRVCTQVLNPISFGFLAPKCYAPSGKCGKNHYIYKD